MNTNNATAHKHTEKSGRLAAPRVFLMYYDRYETATTSKMLPVEHTVLCHDQKDRFTCIGSKGTILQTNRPKGIQHNFNHGLSLLNDGEWAVFMSDDLVGAKRLEAGKFIDCPVDYTIGELMGIIPACDKMGVKLVGLNATGNPFYSKAKYSKYGLVDGRCFAIKKTSFRFHEQISTIPDYYATAWHLNKHGGNLVLNHTFLEFDRYGNGGLGSATERLPAKLKDVALMKHLFPNNVVVKQKPGQAKGSHIIIKR